MAVLSEETLVKTVIEILHDGERGFADIAEHLKDPQVKGYFAKEAQTRGEFARELEADYGTISTEASKEATKIGGTASGTVHRLWADMKANLGGGDHTLLETAEQGEDVAKKAYSEALNGDTVSGSLRAILQKQFPHIQASHDQVKAFRDSRK